MEVKRSRDLAAMNFLTRALASGLWQPFGRHLVRCLFLVAAVVGVQAQETRKIPAALQPWESWATWDDVHRACPTPYSDPKAHRCFWPGQMDLKVDGTGTTFGLTLTVFHRTWVPLPGGVEAWPQGVRVNGEPVAVLERSGVPSISLESGRHVVTGTHRWGAVPQTLRVPSAIGILSLTLDGQAVEIPSRTAEGVLWLRRDASSEPSEKNYLSVKLHAVLEDGIPMWWRQEVELTVAGKSREEDLGLLLPEGWKLASISGPIPVAVDGEGRVKVQVRAGKWTLEAAAFRLDNPKQIRFPAGAVPVVKEELVAFQAKPDFRSLEVLGAPSVDVSQLSFPAKWKELPVYRWTTANPMDLVERMRGMGNQKPGGLAIVRELWLDDDGRGMTFQDRVTAEMQQIWRLDAAPGQDLGSVRAGGVGQLITRNPANNASGVELRSRALDVEATGRMGTAASFSATGWRSDAEKVEATLHLPPGWRLLAMSGADWVRGDWLTAWTLLDLFLLLVFALAVFRLRGWKAALLAFVAFGLAYHEPRAPRYAWLVLLVPIALDRFVPAGVARRVLRLGQGVVMAGFLFLLVPFVTRQIQQALYPQLEPHQNSRFQASILGEMVDATQQAARQAMPQRMPDSGAKKDSGRYWSKVSSEDNMQQDSKARIQTGPGVPEWSWREVTFGWNGPVQAGQQVRPILLSVTAVRLLTVLRTLLLLALAAVLLWPRREDGKPGSEKVSGTGTPMTTGTVALLVALGLWAAGIPTARAATNEVASVGGIPDAATLQKLRERLLEVSDAYPNAASIPSVFLKLQDRRLTMEVEVHAALRTAVPLPGRLPAWSPLAVRVDGKPETVLRRDDGYLWVVLPEGVHRVEVEGMLAAGAEWEWTYLLKPRHVRIEAPGWTHVGVRPDGVPEQQVFFAPERRAAATQASYERPDLQSLVMVDRLLEVGLVWQVQTRVTRLSPAGKALALRLPLLPGENVVSAGAVVRDGFIEVRLGAQESSAEWTSSLAPVGELKLSSQPADAWVERWQLAASPVWNVTLAGLPPIFDPGNAELVPVWQPWPGESVTLTLTRPEATAGATVTVSKVLHGVTVGQRQRVSTLDLRVRCSLGEDFAIELPPNAEVTRLVHSGKDIPVRQTGTKLIVALRPGEQSLLIGWRENLTSGAKVRIGEVRLPVESANIQSTILVAENRWVLWASGPQLGPAVRFWGILLTSLIAAFALGRLPHSPLRSLQWMLLGIGLTQAPLVAAFAVVAWFFVVRWRSTEGFQRLPFLAYNAVQVALVAATIAVVGVLIYVVGEGLLGNPEMFISGNNSTRTQLQWFQARSGTLLPTCGCVSVSIWWYRFLMLLWALWLAVSVLRWLAMAWKAFGSGEYFRAFPARKKAATPPPPPIAAG